MPEPKLPMRPHISGITATELSRLPFLPIASALISRLSLYATLIVTAHLLDGEQFGIFAVSLVVMNILYAFVSGGGDMWLNRFAEETSVLSGQAPHLWLCYFAIVGTISGFLLGAAFLAEASGIIPVPFQGLSFTVAMAAIFMGTMEALLALLRAGGAVRLFFMARDIITPMIYLALLLWSEPGTAHDAINLYFGLWAGACAIAALWLFWQAPRMLPASLPARAAWLPVLRHTLGLIYGNLTSRLAVYIDVLVLTGSISIALIGEYRVAAQFAIGYMVVQHFVFLGLPWQMRNPRLRPTKSLGLPVVVERQKFLVLIAGIGGIIMWILATPLLGLLGERFIDMTAIFRVLLLTRFVSLLWGPQHEILISNGLPTQDAHANVVSIAAWFTLFGVLVVPLGALNAAIMATVGSTFIQHLFRMWILYRHRLPQIYGYTSNPTWPILFSSLTIGFALLSIAG